MEASQVPVQPVTPTWERPVPVFLGTAKVHELRIEKDDAGTIVAMHHDSREDLGQQTTHIAIPQAHAQRILDGRMDYEAIMSGADAATALHDVLLAYGHTSPESPTWVHSPEHTGLGEAIARVFSLVHSPEHPEWEHGGLPPIGGGSPQCTEFFPDPIAAYYARREFNIGTKAGRDAVLTGMFGTSSRPEAFNYIGWTEDNTAFSESESLSTATQLPGTEVWKAGGGLNRAQAVYAHSTGTKSATLVLTFTANGSDTLPFKGFKFGVFNAARPSVTLPVGEMAIETKVTETPFLSSGDKATVTETLEVTAFT